MSKTDQFVLDIRGGGEDSYNVKTDCKIEMGKAEILREGKDATIIAIGKMVPRAMKIAEKMEKDGKNIEVINVRFLKPLDEITLLHSMKKTKYILTMEDNIEFGGLGTAVEEFIVENKLEGINFQKIAYPIEYIKQASVSEIEKAYFMDIDGVIDKLKKLLRK